LYLTRLGTTPNWIFLGGQGFSWRSKLNRQGKYNFLGGDSRQPRNIYSLAVLLGCQGNDGFTWRLHWAAKKTVHFLGGFFASPKKSAFTWWLAAKEIIGTCISSLFSLKHIQHI